jgi:hypothetical protein
MVFKLLTTIMTQLDDDIYVSSEMTKKAKRTEEFANPMIGNAVGSIVKMRANEAKTKELLLTTGDATFRVQCSLCLRKFSAQGYLHRHNNLMHPSNNGNKAADTTAEEDLRMANLDKDDEDNGMIVLKNNDVNEEVE